MTIEPGDIGEARTPSSSPIPLHSVALWLDARDNVAVATVALRPDSVLIHADGDISVTITLREFIPVGHKLALCDLAPDDALIRYGHTIGFASEPIPVGAHVHTHNVAVRPLEHAPALAITTADRASDTITSTDPTPRTFQGYQRVSGRAGTRNNVAVIATVNCSAHVCHEIAAHFTPERLAAYPNVDGVIPIVHAFGCADQVGSRNYTVLQRTLAGIARHPNVAGALVVGLGCEINQPSELVANHDLSESPMLSIQDTGGVRKTVNAGIAAVERLLDTANVHTRTPQPIAELAVALQCGGSDSWSGVTANPVIGRVSDAVVRQGGTAVLAETQEIYGAEHLLKQRTTHPDVAAQIAEKIRWWQNYTATFGLTINNNPSTGNKAGGLTTIYEKSLGAVTKGGSTPLMAVYNYAEPVRARGLVFMDSPGYDPIAVTGQVAGGCNIVLFSTGRGSVFGSVVAPSIKIATNSATFEHMRDDMDFDAGTVLSGDTLGEAAARLMDLLVAVASGAATRSEAQGIGAAEFVPWMANGSL